MASKNLPSPAEILAKFYEAETIYMAAPPEERDINGWISCLSTDFKLYQSPDLPYGGNYDGREGFKKWSDEMASYFDRLEVTDPQVFEKTGSDAVVVTSTLKLRVRKNGEDWVKPLVQIMEVDREKGLLKSIRPFYWDVQGLNDVVRK